MMRNYYHSSSFFPFYHPSFSVLHRLVCLLPLLHCHTALSRHCQDLRHCFILLLGQSRHLRVLLLQRSLLPSRTRSSYHRFHLLPHFRCIQCLVPRRFRLISLNRLGSVSSCPQLSCLRTPPGSDPRPPPHPCHRFPCLSWWFWVASSSCTYTSTVLLSDSQQVFLLWQSQSSLVAFRTEPSAGDAFISFPRSLGLCMWYGLGSCSGQNLVTDRRGTPVALLLRGPKPKQKL